jgi:hypothetical protein
VKAPSPLLGFNNNVRHKGRVFHIQTEDSGVRHPHIITHLFADGGRILKTIKTSYAEHIGQERLGDTVRAMMQEQHKAMFIALRDGQYDRLVEEGGPRGSKTGVEATRAPTNPGTAAQAAQVAPPPSADVVAAVAVAAAPEVVPVAVAVAVAPPEPAPPPVAPPAPARTPDVVLSHERRISQRPAPYAPTEPARRAVGTPSQIPDVAAPLSHRRTGRPALEVDSNAIHRSATSASGTGVDVDLDALERAAAEAQAPMFQQIQNLPPPPAAVLAGKRGSGGGYSSRSTPPPPVVRRSVTPGGRPAISSANRYAPSRPASIFATTRPQEGASIFGEDLISEKSLDEVILSYLAEDLDGPVEKK